MGQLLLLLLIIVGTYASLTVLDRTVHSLQLSPSLRGRLSLAAFFLFTGASHFFMPEEMASMLPAAIPMRIVIIYVTGVLEILGAIGLLIPGLARLASLALILFLIGVLPANIYSAMNYVDFGAHADGPIYLLARIPFQAFVIGWAYYFGVRTSSRLKGAGLEGALGRTAAGQQ